MKRMSLSMAEKPATIDLEEEEQKIETEIRQWSANVIETPNPNFNNIPTCPYAKAAWEKDLVKIVFDHEGKDDQLLKYVSNYDDDYDVVIIVETNYPDDQDGYHEALDNINSLISQRYWGDNDLWVMGFHPMDGESEFLQAGEEDESEVFEPISEYSYGIVFIQRLSLLEEASISLEKAGYYDAYKGSPDIQEMYSTRRSYYRRMQNAKKNYVWGKESFQKNDGRRKESFQENDGRR